MNRSGGKTGRAVTPLTAASVHVPGGERSHRPTATVLRLLTSVFCLLALVISARAADASAKGDEVIYPRATAGAEPAVAGRTGSSPLLLVVALGAAAVGGWLLWRQRRSPTGLGGRDARKLAVVESRGLGNRQYLVVADYDGQKFLLGVCPGRIELLSKLDGETPEGRE
jgi:flagellar protein FliO/FliZ